MEIKVFIICADCKNHIGEMLKPEDQEVVEALLNLASNCNDKIVWHNRNHGRQVYAALVVEGESIKSCNSTLP
jgi:hypothetical protein